MLERREVVHREAGHDREPVVGVKELVSPIELAYMLISRPRVSERAKGVRDDHTVQKAVVRPNSSELGRPTSESARCPCCVMPAGVGRIPATWRASWSF